MGHPAVPFGPPGPSYQRHRPEATTLYAVVSDNVEKLYAAVAAGFEGAALPPPYWQSRVLRRRHDEQSPQMRQIGLFGVELELEAPWAGPQCALG